jgi:hypothetical protein
MGQLDGKWFNWVMGKVDQVFQVSQMGKVD